MTLHDEQVFMQGMVLGAALAFWQAKQAFAELDHRLQRLERELAPRPRIVGRLVPVGWRCGRRMFHVMGRFG
jgi:hypothetical protein